MGYRAKFFEDHPASLRGKFNPCAQIINTSFAEGATTTMRQQIGKLQKAGIVAVRDNELDLRADLQTSLVNATNRKNAIRTHLTELVSELTNAGIYWMPTLCHWAWGLDQDAGVRAAMPVGYPMFGATSLYNTLYGQATDFWSTSTSKHHARYVLAQLAIFGDGGTYAGAAGAKPGANRTTALGGDALVDAIWAYWETEIPQFLDDIGWNMNKFIWLQFLNGPENSGELTLETFWPNGYFGASSTSDFKQQTANTIGRNCGVHVPHITANPNPEANAAARDDLMHERAEWAAKRLSDIIYGNINATNVLLYQSVHWYFEGQWRPRFVGKYNSTIATEIGISRRFDTERQATDDRIDANDDFDADESYWIQAKTGKQIIVSLDGGRTTATATMDATGAQLKTALTSLSMMGDVSTAGLYAGGEDDITVERQQGPSDDGVVNSIETQFLSAGGHATLGYHVRFGVRSSTTSFPGNIVTDWSKSKQRRGPKLTLHNTPAADAILFQWMRGGEVDRGQGMLDFTKYLLNLGFKTIFIHAPIDSRTTDPSIWVYGDSGTAGTYEAWRAASPATRKRQRHVAGPMHEDEPRYHRFFFGGQFGRLLQSRNVS